LKVDNAITRVSGLRRLMCSVASMPLMPGRLIDNNTSSGRSVSDSRITALPSAASPTTEKSGTADNMARSPWRSKVWSSAIRMRYVMLTSQRAVLV